jgi:hypothetical protein
MLLTLTASTLEEIIALPKYILLLLSQISCHRELALPKSYTLFDPGSTLPWNVTAVFENTTTLLVPLMPTVTFELAASTATLLSPLAIAVPLPAPPPEIPVRKAPLP